MKDILSSKEAAEYLGVSYSKLMRLTKEGKVPYFTGTWNRKMFPVEILDHIRKFI